MDPYKAHEQVDQAFDRLVEERDEARAEAARLRREIDHLRRELEEAPHPNEASP